MQVFELDSKPEYGCESDHAHCGSALLQRISSRCLLGERELFEVRSLPYVENLATILKNLLVNLSGRYLT